MNCAVMTRPRMNCSLLNSLSTRMNEHIWHITAQFIDPKNELFFYFTCKGKFCIEFRNVCICDALFRNPWNQFSFSIFEKHLLFVCLIYIQSLSLEKQFSILVEFGCSNLCGLLWTCLEFIPCEAGHIVISLGN